MEHIESNIEILSQTEIFVRTNNDIVNAVVNAQLSTAKSFGIDVTCLSVMDFDGINDLDLCRLLSNMLENAVTACVNSNNTRRHIYLKITSDEGNITFNLKNTIGNSVLANNCSSVKKKAKINRPNRINRQERAKKKPNYCTNFQSRQAKGNRSDCEYGSC